MAGPAQRVRAHIGPKTRCCLNEYYPTAVHCPGCINKLRVDDVYYLPLYRQSDDFAVAVLFQSRWFELLDSLYTRQCVKIGRGKGKTDGAYLLLQPSSALYVPTRSDREVDADLSDWLPALWGYRGSISGDVLRRGPWAEYRLTAEAASEPHASSQPLPPAEELQTMVDVISDSLGMTPPGTARVKSDERKKGLAHRFKESANGNGVH